MEFKEKIRLLHIIFGKFGLKSHEAINKKLKFKGMGSGDVYTTLDVFLKDNKKYPSRRILKVIEKMWKRLPNLTIYMEEYYVQNSVREIKEAESAINKLKYRDDF